MMLMIVLVNMMKCGVCNGSGADVECSDGSYVCDASECPDDGTCTSQVCLGLDGGSMNY